MRLAEKEWFEALNKHRVSGDELKYALQQSRDCYVWPPTISEFLELCKVYRRNNDQTSLKKLNETLNHETIDLRRAEEIMMDVKKKLNGINELGDVEDDLMVYDPLSSMFNREKYEARRRRLMKLSEDESWGLSIQEQYDRVRYLRQEHAERVMEKIRRERPLEESKDPVKRKSKAKEVRSYYDYGDDSG